MLIVHADKVTRINNLPHVECLNQNNGIWGCLLCAQKY